jgi:hypothetical protein
MKLFGVVALSYASARFVDIIDTHGILPWESLSRKRSVDKKRKPECLKDYSSPSADAIAKAHKYLEGHGVFDGHNDLPLTYTYLKPKNQVDHLNFEWFLIQLFHLYIFKDLSKVDLYEREPPGQPDANVWLQNSQTTIPLAKEGKLRAQFWSIYWGCSANGKDAVLWALEQIDVAKRMIAKHDEFIVPKTGTLRDYNFSKTISNF